MSQIANVVNDPTSVLISLFEGYKGDVFPETVAIHLSETFASPENLAQASSCVKS